MRKITEKIKKWTPKWRPRGGHFLVIWLLFSVPGGLGSPNGSQGLSQQPPGSVQASISTDLGSILDDFLMIFCIMWATFYLGCLITFWLPRALIFNFLATSSNVLGSSVGVSRVKKKCDAVSDSRHCGRKAKGKWISDLRANELSSLEGYT